MADEEFDPCTSIWSHNMAVQRLLSILRQRQNYCTDSECLNLLRLPEPRGDLTSWDLMITCLVVGFIVLMYAFRPQSLRRARHDSTKDRKDERDPSGGPPAPPSTN